MTVKIVTDGAADLPIKLLDTMDIKVVPLTVHFDDYVTDSNEDNRLFYERMKNAKNLPKTSSPSPLQFVEAIAPLQSDVIVLSLSSALSSTYQNALIAKEMLEEDGYAHKVEVIDSKTASMGLGLIVLKAARLATEGLQRAELLRYVTEQVKLTRTYFFLDTLENVIKGGRLDRVKGKIASVLNIKLLMRASEEGAVEVMEKIRGSQNAIKRMVDKIGEVKVDFEKAVLAIAHSNDEGKAKDLLEMIKQKYPFREIIISEMGPVIGTYAGEGGLLVTYSDRD
ncbi:DegV family protein [Marinicrinis sediminis]|uniref:DegV family protein n=1 Tax=Marinicrinis sediminis TaxID=1652465 RepID=A0ABW5REA1_9BACL